MTYVKPGITVSTQDENVLAAFTDETQQILLVGTVEGIFPASFSENFSLEGQKNTILSQEGIKSDSLVVTNRGSVKALSSSTDYKAEEKVDANGLTWTYIEKVFTEVKAEEIKFTAKSETLELAKHLNIRQPNEKNEGGVVVTDKEAKVIYEEGIDYVVNYLSGTITQVSAGSIPVETKVKITYGYATIEDGAILIASYTHTPTNVYDLISWEDFNSIIDFYGPAFNVDAINSPISLACLLMNNSVPGAGLPVVKTLAVKPTGETVVSNDWINSLNETAATDTFTHAIVLTKDPSVISALGKFCEDEYISSKFVRGFVAPGSGFKVLERADGVNSIMGLSSRRMQFFSPETVSYTNPITGNLLKLPGFYLAAVHAIMEAVQPYWVSMTRKQYTVFGPFTGNELLTENQKNREATSGITVVENHSGLLWVRDSLTTSVLGTPDAQEPSIIRTLDYLSVDFINGFESLISEADLMAEESQFATIENAVANRLNYHVKIGTIAKWSDINISIEEETKRRFRVKAKIYPRYPLKGIDFEFVLP